jgi:hypothetical protein
LLQSIAGSFHDTIALLLRSQHLRSIVLNQGRCRLAGTTRTAFLENDAIIKSRFTFAWKKLLFFSGDKPSRFPRFSITSDARLVERPNP